MPDSELNLQQWSPQASPVNAPTAAQNIPTLEGDGWDDDWGAPALKDIPEKSRNPKISMKISENINNMTSLPSQ